MTIEEAQAMVRGGKTLEEVRNMVPGSKIIDDALVLEPGTIFCRDDHGDTGEYEGLTREEAAAEYLYIFPADVKSTDWFDVRTWLLGLDEDGDEVEVGEAYVTVRIDPDEPRCIEGEEHDWQSPLEVVGGIEENPGVIGHGGGVICKRVCAKCGRYRLTDSWAQRSDTGEQGLDSVEYLEPDEYSLAWIEGRPVDEDEGDDDA